LEFNDNQTRVFLHKQDASSFSLTLTKHDYNIFFYNIEKNLEKYDSSIEECKDDLNSIELRTIDGEFYTSSTISIILHLIADILWPNWRDDYTTYDPSWGTGNLTKFVQFKNLIATTLYLSDLITASNNNTGAIKEQVDFQSNNQLPEDIKRILNKIKKIVGLFNPPHRKKGTTWDHLTKGANYRNIQDKETDVEKEMRNIFNDNSASYHECQFIYKYIKVSYKIPDNKLIVILPERFFVNVDIREFRKFFLNQFKFIFGFYTNLGDYGGGGGDLVIISYWEKGKTQNKSLDFSHIDNIKDILNVNKLKESKEKILNLDIKKENIRKMFNTFNSIEIKDVKDIKLTQKKWLGGKSSYNLPKSSSIIKAKVKQPFIIEEIINDIKPKFYYAHNFSTLGHDQDTLFSSVYRGGLMYVVENNFLNSIVSFSAQYLSDSKSKKGKKGNDSNKYLLLPKIDDNNKSNYHNWSYSCIPFSLFHEKNYCVASKELQYKNDNNLLTFGSLNYNIENEFCWFSKEMIYGLCKTYPSFEYMIPNLLSSGERFVYNYLQKNNCIKQNTTSYDLMNLSFEILKDFYEVRSNIINGKNTRDIKHLKYLTQKYHLDSWDIGWWQLSLNIIKGNDRTYLEETPIIEYVNSKKFHDFNILYNQLITEIQNGIYLFKFVKK